MIHHRIALAILLIVTTIAAVSVFATLAKNFETGSAASQINCANPCLITITSRGFGNGVVVSRGTIVLWENMDSITHSISSSEKSWTFSTGLIEPSQTSKPIVFSHDGTFQYYCTISMLLGEITVIG